MKKLFAFAVAAVIGFGAVSCNNDDDSKNVSPLVGTWKAETVSYTFGDQTHTYPYNVDGGPFAGCPVDMLNLNENNSAVLEEHIPNEADECTTVASNGTWTDTNVNVKDIDRTVVSIDGNELVLAYPISFYGQTLPITVNYSRQ